MMLDPLFLLFALLALGMIAAMLTKSTFSKYAQVGARSGLTGAEAARRMLVAQGVQDVEIHQSQGFLSDHYNPKTHSLHLSPDVYNGQSLSAIGVACHEAGHALQQAQGYALMSLRAVLLPVTIAGQNIAPMFAAAVLFSIITLPIEWDASARAKTYMVDSGIVTAAEYPHAAKVLNAAFLTYVAGAVTAVLQLLYFLMRAGLLGGRRD
jgi:Zn-dependent membrane protease YugP